MAVELPVHNENGVATVGRSLDVAELGGGIGGIEGNDVAVLVGLLGSDEVLVFVDGEVFAVGSLQKAEFHCCVAEFLVGEHAVFYEDADVVPLFLELGAVGLEQVVEARSHFLGDVAGDFLHGGVALEV